MKSALSVGRWVMLCAALAGAGAAGVRAMVLRLTPADIERALSLSRFPHSDADRTQFHKRYTIPVQGDPVDAWMVDNIEVITEFRRVELMAEEHVRINDLWGRGGLGEVEEAMRPWQGRLSLVAHLSLVANHIYAGDVPPVDVVVDGLDAAATIDSHRTNVYANCGGDAGCALSGGLAEEVLESAAVGQAARSVRVLWNGKELARVTINFAALD
jgi:hypothetical protein